MRYVVYEGSAFGAAFKPPDRIPAETCSRLQEDAEEFVLTSRGQLWDIDRHAYAATTDVDVLRSYDIARSLRVSSACVPIFEWIRELFAIPASIDLLLKDCFVARYLPTEQASLKRHVDGTLLSFVMALSDPAAYEGGETNLGTNTTGYTHNVRLERGEYVVFPGGLIHHSVLPVTSGARYMLVGFVSLTCATWISAQRMLSTYQDRVKERLSKLDSKGHKPEILKVIADIPSQLMKYDSILPRRP